MDEHQQLLAEEMIGEEARAFLKTPIGQYIDGCSQQDIDRARDDLLALDPFKFQTLQDLQSHIAGIQNRVKAAESLRQYLAEAIERGKQATHQMTQADY